MEKLLVLITSLLLSAPVLAQTPGSPNNPAPVASEDVSIVASLTLNRCTADRSVLCMGFSESPGPITIKLLQAQGEGYAKGYHLVLKEMDGVRFIGIVQVVKYEYVDNAGAKSKSYNISVEILNGSERSASMSIGVSEMNQLPAYNTIYGNPVKLGGFEYSGYLTIGRAPQCDSVTGECTNIVTPSGVRWDVLQGSLK